MTNAVGAAEPEADAPRIGPWRDVEVVLQLALFPVVNEIDPGVDAAESDLPE